MKRTVLLAVVLLVISTGVPMAQEPIRSIKLSIVPQIDIPLPPDSNLFQLGGGAATGFSYTLASFRAFSVGVLVDHHLGRLDHVNLGNLGSLSVISAEATAGLRYTFVRRIDAYFSSGIGYFYAFETARYHPGRPIWI